jgi:hypothetical protein
MEGFMRVNFFALVLLVSALSASASAAPTAVASQHEGLLQRSIEFAATTTKRKPQRAAPQTPQPLRRGFADPSFGPDGKPYKVPEYLRGQCYIDDGYGRFSACNNRI